MNVHLSGRPLPAYGLSLFRSRVPLFVGAEENARFRVRVPEASFDQWVTPADRSFETVLERTTHTVAAFAQLPDQPEQITTLLPPNSWPHFPEARVSIASHVRPRDLAIEPYRSEDPRMDPEARLARSFERIRDRVHPTYVEPEMRALPGDSTYQRVLWPLDVETRSEATCLDLALLLAGVAEANGDRPVVLFTGKEDQSPEHAFLGLWVAGDRPSNPLLGADLLRQSFSSGRLVAIETTEVCRGRSRSFEAAREEARAHTCAKEIHGVDIGVARTTVAPLELDYDTHAAAALEALRRLEKDRNLQRRESLLVLYGLVAAEGPVTREILGRTQGLDLLRNSILTLLPRGIGEADRVRPTTGYVGVIRSARQLARSGLSSEVREIDLLRAVLEASGPGSKTRHVMDHQGLSWMDLLTTAAARYPDGDGDSTLAFRPDEENGP